MYYWSFEALFSEYDFLNLRSLENKVYSKNLRTTFLSYTWQALASLWIVNLTSYEEAPQLVPGSIKNKMKKYVYPLIDREIKV